jgi:hypothetical protein
MVRRIKVTRHGLTNCPSCSAHIKLASVVTETTCPFCNTALSVAASGNASGLLRSLASSVMAGRSSLIVASLLSLGGVAACESNSGNNGNGDVVMDEGPPPSDVPDQPLYGAVPDDVGPPMDAATDDADAEPPAQALYGAPADPGKKA